MTDIKKRLVWIDIAKFFAITLVVFGHVWRGLYNEDLISNDTLYTQIDNAIYYFHMPLFFMVSGFLFLKASQDKWSTMWKKQLYFIIWPYLLWSVTTILMKYAIDVITSNNGNLDSLYKILYEPPTIFWFLYVLFVYQNLLKFLFEKTQSIVAILLVGLALNAASHTLKVEHLMIVQLFNYNMLFFVIGFCIAKTDIINKFRINAMLAIASIFLFIAIQLSCFSQQIDLFSPLAAVTGIILSLCVFLICLYLQHFKLMTSRLILFVSSATLCIYVTHIIFTVAIRTVLTKLGIESLSVHLIAGTTVGLALPLIGYYIAQKLRLSALAGFGPNSKSAIR